VLSEILTFALNHVSAPAIGASEGSESADVSCVFAFDAYHYPNAYLGASSQQLSFRSSCIRRLTHPACVCVRWCVCVCTT
jgi:hypothetical protein